MANGNLGVENQFAVFNTGATPVLSQVRRAYVVFMLVLLATLNGMDRMILSVLLIPIQRDLSISDAGMGMLTGGGFAIVYATAAIPFARYADVGNRRNLVGVCLACWSAAAMLCGAATGYFSLMAARLGIAASESSFNPAALSMVADLSRPHRRATTVGIVMLGSGLGTLVGSALGGAANAAYGWRAAMMIVGAPGLLVAALFLLTVPEPARTDLNAAEKIGRTENLRETVRSLIRVRTFVPLCVAFSLYNMAAIGCITWMPAFLTRTHHLDGATMGLWFGITIGVGGILGNVGGGLLADRLSRGGGAHWYMLIPGISAFVQIPIALTVIFAVSSKIALLGMFLFSVVGYFCNASALTAGIQIVRPRTRALISAALFFCTTVIGLGVGPVLVGALSDYLTPSLGLAALSHAFLVVPVLHFLSGLMFLKGSRTIEGDVRRANA
jgi:predicted MFS family arabinose efflux permease